MTGVLANKSKPNMETCRKGEGARQYWEYNKGVIGRGMYYLTYTTNHTLLMRKRKPKIRPTIWNYYYGTKQIGVYELDLCLTHRGDELTLEDCDSSSDTLSQHWTFSNLNLKLLES